MQRITDDFYKEPANHPGGSAYWWCLTRFPRSM